MKEAYSECLPAAAAADTVESLRATHGPQRPIISWLLLLGIFTGLVSLPLIKVDTSVRARGLVKPTTEPAELKSVVAGHIAEVFVADHAFVRKAQPLLRLEAAELEQRLIYNRAEQAERGAVIADLLQLTALPEPARAAAVPVPSTGLFTRPRASEWSSPSPDQPSAAMTPSGRIEPQTNLIRQEWSQFQARADTYRLAESKARGELARYIDLASKGIATQQELENARYEVERLVSEDTLMAEQMRAQWQNRLREERTLLETLRSEEQRLLAELNLYTLRAPVDGVLVGFASVGTGRTVLAGQFLGAISPTDALRVEAYISPRDIGLVRIGQRARLQVDAFPYTRWGTLDGQVESISDDLLSATDGPGTLTGQAQRAFVAVVRPYQERLRLANGVQGQLKKGMTLSVRFLTARRSLLQIIYEDASQWIDPQSG